MAANKCEFSGTMACSSSSFSVRTKAARMRETAILALMQAPQRRKRPWLPKTAPCCKTNVNCPGQWHARHPDSACGQRQRAARIKSIRLQPAAACLPKRISSPWLTKALQNRILPLRRGFYLPRQAAPPSRLWNRYQYQDCNLNQT